MIYVISLWGFKGPDADWCHGKRSGRTLTNETVKIINIRSCGYCPKSGIYSICGTHNQVAHPVVSRACDNWFINDGIVRPLSPSRHTLSKFPIPRFSGPQPSSTITTLQSWNPFQLAYLSKKPAPLTIFRFSYSPTRGLAGVIDQCKNIQA